MIVARAPINPPGATSLTRSFTKSQPLSLASIAQLNIAKLRTRLLPSVAGEFPRYAWA
jgi:hypothetical protein